MKLSKFQSVIAAAAAISVGSLGFAGFTAIQANQRVAEARAQGIEEGRKGYIKAYTDGKIYIRNYEGLGNYVDCKKNEIYFGKDSEIVKQNKVKAEVGYNLFSEFRLLDFVGPDDYFYQKQVVQAACWAAGYRPDH